MDLPLVAREQRAELLKALEALPARLERKETRWLANRHRDAIARARTAQELYFASDNARMFLERFARSAPPALPKTALEESIEYKIAKSSGDYALMAMLTRRRAAENERADTILADREAVAAFEAAGRKVTYVPPAGTRAKAAKAAKAPTSHKPDQMAELIKDLIRRGIVTSFG